MTQIFDILAFLGFSAPQRSILLKFSTFTAQNGQKNLKKGKISRPPINFAKIRIFAKKFKADPPPTPRTPEHYHTSISIPSLH